MSEYNTNSVLKKREDELSEHTKKSIKTARSQIKNGKGMYTKELMIELGI
jgi:hypothetical protein